ncbi:MAG: SBBP repeat-containing protein [Saprospiraceae bacterium]|nr:SBBP repeat-containing protein [Saprospiraceae bacterium]
MNRKTYSLRPNIDDSYFPTSILVDESGSIYILGNIQYKESLAYTVGFLLKLDQDGNQIYWKLYEKETIR